MNTPAEEKATILVVDDNPLIVNVLSGLLASENYHVFASANGREAIDVITNKHIDVIICDVMMPQMDGYELHHWVRKKAEFGHIPFIFLTALDDSREIKRGKETGADDYVVKPFDAEHMLSVIKGKVVRSKMLRNLSEEKYDSYRRKVIHTLSHEFRTPLVAINTGTELLMEQHGNLDTQRMQNLLEAIRRGGQRLEGLVNDFMLLQQVEAGIASKLFANRAAVKLVNEVVTDAIEFQRELLTKEGFTVTVNDQCEGAKVKVYAPQVYDILGRLINNSVKFRGVNREIEIYICSQGSEIALEVRDRGIGISVEKVKEAIDVFGQIDRDKLEQQGGGLGLAIANRYATIHGGKLEFEKRAGGGSVVTLVLPKWTGEEAVSANDLKTPEE